MDDLVLMWLAQVQLERHDIHLLRTDRIPAQALDVAQLLGHALAFAIGCLARGCFGNPVLRLCVPPEAARGSLRAVRGLALQIGKLQDLAAQRPGIPVVTAQARKSTLTL